ncbi:hypothetical protein Tco_0441063 [Tanacetum coccineum]
MTDVAFDLVIGTDDSDGLGIDLWYFGRDIPRDILGHYTVHEEFRIDFFNEIFKFLHQHGVIGIDVASTGGNICIIVALVRPCP